MLPRIFNAHFGLLDDAVTLAHSHEALTRPSIVLYAYGPAGRFLPCYWIYWAFWYLVGGDSPAVYFMGNAALLAGTVAALGALMRKWGAGAFETWTASLFFLFSAPAAECYFTLSKGEPVTLLAFLCALLLAHRAGCAERPARYWTLAAVLALLAFGTRETSIASFGVVGIWYVMSFWRGFGKPVLLSRRAMAVYLCVLVAGVAPILIGRVWMRHAITAGSYASGYQFTWVNISANIVMWSFYLVRDYAALCLFLAAAGLLAWRRKIAPARVQPLVMMAAWMGCCAAIYLPWRYLSNYYLLPFSAAAAVFCGLMAGELRAQSRAEARRRLKPAPHGPASGGQASAQASSAQASRGQGSGAQASAGQASGAQASGGQALGGAGFSLRGTSVPRIALAVAAVFLAIDALDSFTAAHSQVIVDEANAELVEALRRLPPDSTVLMNLQFDQEYVYEIQIHLSERLGRRDLRIKPLDFTPPDPRDAGHPYYVVSMQSRHERWPLLRGPILESTLLQWNGSLHGLLGQAAPLRRIDRSWQMADIGLQYFWCFAVDRIKPICSLVMCHTSERPAIDMRETSYGWTIDPYPAWKEPVEVATFADGVWTLGGRKLALGQPGDLPVAADWDGGGLLEPGVYRPSANRWFIDHNQDFTVADMQPGDLPVAGDWTGAHKAAPGFFRPSDGSWHLGTLPVIHLGGPDTVPLVGDWDADGRDTPAVYLPAVGSVILINSFREDAPKVVYTPGKGAPVVVNWSGTGVDTVNTVQDGKWSRRFANCDCMTSNPAPEFSAGALAGSIFAGRWRK